MRAFVWVAVVSLVLFVCDYRFDCFSELRLKASFAAVVMQRVVNFPVALYHQIAKNFISKREIITENSRLNSELLANNVKLQRLNYLEHENSQLRVLLNYSKQITSRSMTAQLLSSIVDDFGQQLTINKGKQHGIYVGQPVLDAYGLLGQVISVNNDVSKVLLITNRKSAIPVIIIRNGLRAIAVGAGDGECLELVNISETADVKVGDVLVTSGLEKRFPVGYQVGVIKKISRVIGERFVKVCVTPAAHVNGGNLYVLLIWSGSSEKGLVKNKKR